MNKSNLPYFLHCFRVIICHLAIVMCITVSIGGIWLAARAGSIGLVVGIMICITLPFMVLSGLLIARTYGPKLADSFTDFLLYPRYYLKKSPPLLSPVRGMLAAGEYLEAEEQLLKLHNEAPEYPEIALMLFDLYEIRFENPEAALDVAANYFSQPLRKSGSDNLTLLFRTVSRLPSPEARALLSGEYRKKLYNQPERNAISERLIALEAQA